MERDNKRTEKLRYMDKKQSVSAFYCRIQGRIWNTRVTEQVTERVTEQTLISKVVKKIKRGKNIAEIADELEETVETVTPVYEAALKAAPDYDEAAIYEALKK